ncbi:MAG TPA: hypothetical protein VLG71_00085 [Candidatus Limnocylindria bacterium]|nr:hypothetical protein [Candidatus Limnocylindria bacterium]
MKQVMITACAVTLIVVVNLQAAQPAMTATPVRSDTATATALRSATPAPSSVIAPPPAAAVTTASARPTTTPAPATSVRASGSAPTTAMAPCQQRAASSVTKDDPRVPVLIATLKTQTHETIARYSLERCDEISALTAQLDAAKIAAQKSSQESQRRYEQLQKESSARLATESQAAQKSSQESQQRYDQLQKESSARLNAMLATESQAAHGEITRLEQEKNTKITAMQKEHADALQSLTNKHITYASLGALAIIAWFKRDTIIKWCQQGKEKISAYVKTYTATRGVVNKAS